MAEPVKDTLSGALPVVGAPGAVPLMGEAVMVTLDVAVPAPAANCP